MTCPPGTAVCGAGPLLRMLRRAGTGVAAGDLATRRGRSRSEGSERKRRSATAPRPPVELPIPNPPEPPRMLLEAPCTRRRSLTEAAQPRSRRRHLASLHALKRQAGGALISSVREPRRGFDRGGSAPTAARSAGRFDGLYSLNHICCDPERSRSRLATSTSLQLRQGLRSIERVHLPSSPCRSAPSSPRLAHPIVGTQTGWVEPRPVAPIQACGAAAKPRRGAHRLSALRLGRSSRGLSRRTR